MVRPTDGKGKLVQRTGRESGSSYRREEVRGRGWVFNNPRCSAGCAARQLGCSTSEFSAGQLQGDGGFSLLYLLLLALGLVVLAMISALTLLFGGSRSGRSGAGSGGLTLSHTGTSNLGRASLLEDGRWVNLIAECVEVVDDLDEHLCSFNAPRREWWGR